MILKGQKPPNPVARIMQHFATFVDDIQQILDSCNPVRRAYTNRGFSFVTTSGPNPNLSITPGLNGSISTSAEQQSFLSTFTPSGFFKLRAMERLPRAVTS